MNIGSLLNLNGSLYAVTNGNGQTMSGVSVPAASNGPLPANASIPNGTAPTSGYETVIPLANASIQNLGEQLFGNGTAASRVDSVTTGLQNGVSNYVTGPATTLLVDQFFLLAFLICLYVFIAGGNSPLSVAETGINTVRRVKKVASFFA